MEYKDMLNALYARHNLITSLADTIEKKLKSFPSGRIEIKHIGNKYYYYYVTGNTKTQLLDADNKLIYELIQKNYLEKVIKAARKELTVIDGVKHHYPETVVEDIYDSLSQERQKYTKPIIPSYEQFLNEWQNRPFEPKQIKEGTPVFETMRGEHVRSKSEQLIADRLFVNGIPYKYECPLKVGNKIIHPDFTILRKSDRMRFIMNILAKQITTDIRSTMFRDLMIIFLTAFYLEKNSFSRLNHQQNRSTYALSIK